MVYWCIFESPIAAYVVGQHPDGVVLHDKAHQGVESPDGQLVGGETAAILMEGILRLGSNGDADDGQHENDSRQPTNPFAPAQAYTYSTQLSQACESPDF